jgi:hypothetical protein
MEQRREATLGKADWHLAPAIATDNRIGAHFCLAFQAKLARRNMPGVFVNLPPQSKSPGRATYQGSHGTVITALAIS